MDNLVKVMNKVYPSSARFFGKVGDKPDRLRPMFQYVKDNMQGGLVGVEVGVDRAVNARKVLDLMDIEMLYLVDPYMPYEHHRTLEQQREYKEQAKSYLSGYDDFINWLFYDSVSASIILKDFVFDFVYIDANHDYSNVLNDCVRWFPLVKDGGVLGGHDFNGSHLDLQEAVHDFCEDNDLRLFVKPDDWWVVK